MYPYLFKIELIKDEQIPISTYKLLADSLAANQQNTVQKIRIIITDPDTTGTG